jgi:CO/xanthine dehydrogenase FAD-binding subunit
MKPAPFDYRCPDSLEETIELLARYGGDCKLMAGGQSLTPMLNFRVVKPEMIIDIRKVLEMDYVRQLPGFLHVGALTRHRILETSPVVAAALPIIPETMHHVAHLAIRNRGTIGGSLSHADPAAELPMLSRLLDADIQTRSVRGERTISAHDFFLGPLTNALEDDELLVRIDLPVLQPGTGWCFMEHARRAGDFALAAVGAVVRIEDGIVAEARVAMMGVGDTPLRCPDAEEALLGQAPSDAQLDQAARVACASLEPRQDLHASAEYRKHLAQVLARRVLRMARGRAKETTT